MIKNLLNLLLISSFSILISCSSRQEKKSESTYASNEIPYSVKFTLPHDAAAFTQGLVIHDNKIYESTGRSNSYLAEIDIHSGIILNKVSLGEEYFGEGITILNGKIYQLTWTTNIGFIYDLKTLKSIGTFSYDTEGWGLTTDGSHLIMSDGSDKLYYLDTLDFKKVKTLHIKENNIPVNRLNELEYHEGKIYANQWETNYIYKIDPATEKVEGRINLTPLVNEIRRNNPDANVLNGIAYNENTGDFLITGKLWPKSYWISLKGK
ncbi:MAG: glutaminyl-peptide cyclotransferase [Bacteroidota bacterium]|nr:glutaminyl-peptide cyclotransferase [Bacteroidota bacterium]